MSQQRQSVEDARKVLEISRALVATEDLDALLKLVVDRGMELLTAERATVFLYDAERDELVSRIAAGATGIRIPASAGIAGAAARSMTIINVPDAYADERFNREVDRRTGFRTRNILAIPLPDYQGRLVGLLQVLNKREGTFDAYDTELAQSLAAQAGVAIQRAQLIQHYLAKQEMERAMRIARDIQRGLLPGEAPPLEGFEIAGFSRPADETGGDIYDFLSLGDAGCLISVADATGHGIGPALVIAETRAMVRALCHRGGGPCTLRCAEMLGPLLTTVNAVLHEDLQAARFVTCFLGALDPAESVLTWASAGHGPILFYDRADDNFQVHGATALPLGVLPDENYDGTMTLRMAAGDFAAVITDGFNEAQNADGEEFGVERVQEMLRGARDAYPREMIETLDAAVRRFTGKVAQADDRTAVIFKKL